MEKTNIKIIIQDIDERGTVFRGEFNKQEKFLIAEINKGHTRGGHYHNIDTYHFVLLGVVKYYEIPMDGTKKEIQKIVKAGSIIETPANAAHMLTALEDCIIIEPSGGGKITKTYAPYREFMYKNN